MPPATRDRNTPERGATDRVVPLAANARIWAGVLVFLNAAGFAVPGSTALNLIYLGRAAEAADNTGGAAGAREVRVERGCFRFDNDGSITRANIGATAWCVDDQTVAATNGGNTRSAAGTIYDVDAAGVWVLN